jgi:hypothetical protein
MRTLEIRKDMRAGVFPFALCFLDRVIYIFRGEALRPQGEASG